MILNLLFNLFLVLWSITYSFITIPIIFLPYYFISTTLNISVRVALFMLYFLCGIKYEVIGIENIPKEKSFIIASKHQSTLETFIFLLLFKGSVFILKKELKWIPFLGLHLMALKMIFIDRKSGVGSIRTILKLAKMRIQENKNVIIFPEGTRVKVGKNAKYKAGIATLYHNLSVPVLPVALNTGLFWPGGIFSLKKRRGSATIEILPQINPGLSKGDFLEKLRNVIEERSHQLEKDVAGCK
ncbi:lysophospholipid acyltransferase family protein [Wolbachia endosymbiont of Pentidionis agamae]|uniref:lysophospholipid acyltransferase family protein n=1 Tax=Wolbachia endosymbiont of Pentidionis agamae TaxID=3110435 RepID=UPI0038CD995A